MTILTVTDSSDSATDTGSLRYALAHAQNGDTINFASNVTQINLSSTLAITKNVTIEGAKSGSTPGVTINGQGNVTDFTVNASATNATIDGLVIENGKGAGAVGAAGGSNYAVGTNGGGAGGAIFDSGGLTLTNSQILNSKATGGTGGAGGTYGGGGGGGSAAGGVYVASGATLKQGHLYFNGNSAYGGTGGNGGGDNNHNYDALGPHAGGVGGVAHSSGPTTASGQTGDYGFGYNGTNSGGAPGQPGASSPKYAPIYSRNGTGGGGGGGNAFANIGGQGTVSNATVAPETITVTNANDSGAGSLRAALSFAGNGDSINFASNVTQINLGSTLAIITNVTIEGGKTVTINGQSNVTDFTVGSGVTTTIDGLTIEGGKATGAVGYSPTSFNGGFVKGGAGGSVGGAIFDSGTLTLTNSHVTGNTATGGAGGAGGKYSGGGGGGSGGGGIYVAGGATFRMGSDSFSGNSATGGKGGLGGFGYGTYTHGRGGNAAGGAGGTAQSSGPTYGRGAYGASGAPDASPSNSPEKVVPGIGGHPGQAGGNAGRTGSSDPNFATGQGGGGGGGSAFADYGGAGTVQTVCYVAGTTIRTSRGDIAIEDLAVGDLVVAASGATRPIRWLGHRTLDCRTHQSPREVMPVRVAAHAFGDNRPARDLFLSPGHSVCVDLLGEVLIPIGRLANGATIAQDNVATVTYWHLELDAHDIVLAEGLPCESYIDCGNRAFFAEGRFVDLAAAPDAWGQTTSDSCRPFHPEGALVDLARDRLRLRAGELGWRLEAVDPLGGLWLEVDGERLEPVRHDLIARATVPANAREVRLRSSAAVPAEIDGSNDNRRLGLPLISIAVDDRRGGRRAIGCTDARLDKIDGFHAEEGTHRWTDGNARLPLELWDGCRRDVNLCLAFFGPALPRWIAPAAGDAWAKAGHDLACRAAVEAGRLLPAGRSFGQE